MSEVSTASTYDAAVGYVKRGWAVVPLHGLSDKTPSGCTCIKIDCKSQGKHPRQKNWTTAKGKDLTWCQVIWGDGWVGGDHVGADKINLGIVTGRVSGIFVFDIDPRNGGDRGLAELVAKYGELPRTYTVRTGQGGLHIYFKMPEFAVSNKKREIPDGIDVKGDGGQVVAPPSRSIYGDYWVEVDAPVADAPAWLLELLKADHRTDTGSIVMVDDLPRREDLDHYDQTRCYAYAMKVIESECDAYQSADWHHGGLRLYAACCNILEVLQSPWSGVDVTHARRSLEMARAMRYERAQAAMRPGNGQLPDELEAIWRSAARKVAGKGRALPADNRYDGVILDPFDFGDATVDRKNIFLQPPDPNTFDEESQVITEAERVAADAAAAEVARQQYLQLAVIRKAEELRILEKAREYLRAEDRAAEKVNSSSAIISGLDFLNLVDDEEPPLWGDGDSCLWASGESLMIVGPPGVGKSTITQLVVWARIGLKSAVLDFPVADDGGKVLYLAMDRPKQIARAMRRLVAHDTMDVVRERLAVHRGPLLVDITQNTEWLLRKAQEIGASTIVVDSVKDILPNPSNEEPANLYNKSRQLCLTEGIEWIELHHNRKAGAENKAPKTLDDVYGSRWLTAGAGSVVSLYGQPGDTVVEMSQIKTPSGEFIPKSITMNKEYGTMAFFEAVTLEDVLTSVGLSGVTVREAASRVYKLKSPTPSNIESTRNKLLRMVKRGTVEPITPPFTPMGTSDPTLYRWLPRG